MSKKIIFSTGGTGGHILPAINLMKHFFNDGYEVLLVTDYRGSVFIKNNTEFKSYIIKASTPTNKNLLDKILFIPIIFYSLVKSIIILKKEKPDLVFGFGGYVSFPISIVSKLFNIPLIIYENNTILGRSNRILSYFSQKILTAKEISNNFSERNKSKSFKVGSIINKSIINYIPKNEKYKNNFFSILVLGGSQGAEIFGNIIPPMIKKLKDKGIQVSIKQQCVKEQKSKIIDFYRKNNIKNYIFEFDENIVDLISSSQLAITRCGASATAELTQIATPFIGVPLPNSIDDHQYLNAKYYENNGCCWVLEQKNFNTNNLFNLVMETVENKNKLETISKNMKKINNNNVYIEIEKEIKDFI
jgi:UDP-N-acetylglucosamine--N-acetylmuramyl-(pentapeptide) pyrophosphoryl-undecaprenol N-acetylglucosamine transferase